MNKTFFGLILAIVVSCTQQRRPTFSLHGKTNGIENGTVLYLEDNLTKKVIDSAVVHNDQFEFSTKIEKFPARVLLRNEDFSQWRDIWVEKNKITFDASTTDFKNATVTGSRSEDLAQKLYATTDTLSFEERLELNKNFVEKHPNSMVSAHILSVYARDWGKDFTKKQFEDFSGTLKMSVYGERISNYIELNRDVKIGDSYSDFETVDRNGDLKKLSELLGKVTLLEFWASWCGPCRKENPILVETYNTFKTDGFEIVAISLDKEKEKWIEAIQKDGLEWPNFCDFEVWESKASLVYGVYEIPDNFLIDQNGIIVARNIRGEELNNKLEELNK